MSKKINSLGFVEPAFYDPYRSKRIVEEAAKIHAAYQKRCADSFKVFYRGLMIEAGSEPRVFEDVGAGFQKRFFEDITESLEALRDGDMPPCRRWWLERTKKASKDADLAIILTWLTAFATRPFHAQVGAADRDQAGIIKDRVSRLLEFNPWLKQHIELINYEIRSTKKQVSGQPLARVDIEATQTGGGAHGAAPDLLILNEITHVNHKWEFVQTMMDNADGVATGIVIIATNAGFKGTKAEIWRNNAIAGIDTWKVHTLDRPAPWHSHKTLADTRKRSPKSVYARLWEGRWVSGKGDAIDEDKIDKVFQLDGPVMQPEQGWEYVLGVDLGVKHDHSAVFVLAINFAEQRLKSAYWKAWEPLEATGEVDLMDVEQQCTMLFKLYRASYLFYDPDQAKLMAQQMSRKGVVCREMRFIASNLVRMASSFQQVVDAGKLQCYDDAHGRLRNDFSKFNIVEKSYGVRLEAVSDETGHADIGTALVITLPFGLDALNGFNTLQPDEDITCPDDSKLTEKEIKDMPDDLREIYEDGPLEEADFEDDEAYFKGLD